MLVIFALSIRQKIEMSDVKMQIGTQIKSSGQDPTHLKGHIKGNVRIVLFHAGHECLNLVKVRHCLYCNRINDAMTLSGMKRRSKGEGKCG
jgi:hypothetical protein